MRRVVVPLLALAALCVLLSVRATPCHAGILLPQQVSFGESDLVESLDAASQLLERGFIDAYTRRISAQDAIHAGFQFAMARV